MRPLFKTVIVIWSDYDTGRDSLQYIAFAAEEGDTHCSQRWCSRVEDPQDDPDWDGTEFFGVDEE